MKKKTFFIFIPTMDVCYWVVPLQREMKYIDGVNRPNCGASVSFSSQGKVRFLP